MSFIADFRDGFRGTSTTPPAETPLSKRDQAQSATERLAASVRELRVQLATSETERRRLSDVIAERDGTIEEARQLIRDAAAEIARLEGELTKARQEPEPAGDAKKVADRVWRAVAKNVHPDLSPEGETAKQALERVFKSVRAEVERIKKS